MDNIIPKEEQLQSVGAIYRGESVFVWLPTGYGKSLCYQMLPFLMDFKLHRTETCLKSAIIVVSPLISLIADQIKFLKSKGVATSVIASGSDLIRSYLATPENLHTDSILFCSPEALALTKWSVSLTQPRVFERIVAVVIDEAHCVSKW